MKGEASKAPRTNGGYTDVNKICVTEQLSKGSLQTKLKSITVKWRLKGAEGQDPKACFCSGDDTSSVSTPGNFLK
jgi:hypothetical protein